MKQPRYKSDLEKKAWSLMKQKERERAPFNIEQMELIHEYS